MANQKSHQGRKKDAHEPDPPDNTPVVGTQRKQHDEIYPFETKAQASHWYSELTKIKPEWAMVLLTAVIAGSTICYTIFSYRQWGVTIAALRANTDSFKADQQPYLWHTKRDIVLLPNQRPHLNLTFVNLGKSPAHGVYCRTTISYWPDRSTSSEERAFRKAVSQPSGQPGQSIPPTGDFFTTAWSDVVLDHELLLSINSGRTVLYAAGIIEFADQFGDPHATEFCGAWDPVNQNLQICGLHNTVR